MEREKLVLKKRRKKRYTIAPAQLASDVEAKQQRFPCGLNPAGHPPTN